MRLLSIRADHAGGEPTRPDSRSDRRADRCRKERQYLPLRHVSENSACDQASGQAVSTPSSNRREFLAGGASAAAALLLGFHLPASGRARKPALAARSDTFTPNAWLRITPDNQITILAEKPELGQGAWTYTAMMVAEELEVDWSTIRVEQAPTIPSIYKGLHAGGSGGVASSFLPMRKVGAQAREMLRAAAAAHWRAPMQDCSARNGTIVQTPTNRRLSYRELALAAARLPVVQVAQTDLKRATDFRVIGQSMPRVDLYAKVTGSAKFGIDVRVPSMRYAVIARCPYFGGRLINCDDSAARAIPGVRAVFPIAPLPRRYNTAGGVAVVAESTWAAIQGRQALLLEWTKGASEGECTAGLRRLARQRAADTATWVAVDRGDTPAALGSTVKRIEACYESPFQAHATMEPMNTTVHVRDEDIEVWSPTQFADEVQSEITALSGIPLDRAIVHMTFSGGSCGRRYQCG